MAATITASNLGRMFLCLIFIFTSLIHTGQCNGFWDEECPRTCFCTKNNTQGIILTNCSNLGLKKVPSDLPPSTEILLLSGNQIQQISRGQLRSLENVQLMNLSNNYLSVLSNETFSDLKTLRILDISHNLLLTSSESFHPGCFYGLSRLKRLFMQGNLDVSGRLTTYPDDALSALNGLESLFIDGLPEVPFGPGFSSLSNLTNLTVSGLTGKCQIKKIDQSLFDNLRLTKLQHLDLSFCGISVSGHAPFSILQNLQFLDLSNNDRMSFPGVRNATAGLAKTSIQTLNLARINRHTGIVNVASDDLKYLGQTNLSSLILDGNQIGTFEDDLFTVLPKSISYLSFEMNYFYRVIFLRSVHLMKNLNTLDISNQFYQGRLGRQIVSYALLESAFTQHSNGAHNDYVINLPTKLEILYASNIKLSYPIPSLTFSKNRVKVIDLSHNDLQSVIGTWSGLHSLAVFDLSFNEISYINPFFFRDMSAIKTLFLAGNRLKSSLDRDRGSLLFSTQSKLEILDLGSNGITDVPRLLFAKTKRLKKLLIRDNDLTNIDVSLEHLKDLQLLDLSFNLIQSVGKVTRGELDTIWNVGDLNINLNGNSLQCTCNEQDFLDWMNKNKVHFVDIDNYTCAHENGSVVKVTEMMKNLEDIRMACISKTVLLACFIGFFASCFLFAVPIVICAERRRIKYYLKVKRKKARQYENLNDTSEKSYDVYISYDCSKEIAVLVRMIKERLDRSRITTFIRDLDVPVGSPEVHGIYNGIMGSKVIVLLLTHEILSPRDHHRRLEINMAIEESLFGHREMVISCLVQNVFLNADDIDSGILQFLNTSRPYDPGDDIENLLVYIESETRRLLK